MTWLALDTSSPTAAIALIRADGSTTGRRTDPTQRHGRSLIPDLRDLLRQAEIRTTDLRGIAVGLGPGSFTGLRIGITAAKSLAYVVGCPLWGLDSLEILARGADADFLRIAALVDAQKGQVCAAEFARERPGGPIVRLGPNQLRPRAEFLNEFDPNGCVVGHSEAWNGATGPAIPTLDALVATARSSIDRDPPANLWTIEPIYARPSAAEEKAPAGP